MKAALAALESAVRELWRRRAVSAGALLAIAAATLAVSAAVASGPRVVDRRTLALAVIRYVCAGSLAGLFIDGAQSLLLCSMAGVRGPSLLRLAIERIPPLVTLNAMEMLLYTTIAGATFDVAVVAPRRGVLGNAAMGAVGLVWIGTLVCFVFLSFRVATVLTGRGVPPAPALTGGIDLVMRRFGGVLAVSGAWLIAALPMWTVLLGLELVDRHYGPHGGWRALVETGRALAVAAAWLLGYAVLGAFVARDTRLATG